MIHLSYAFVPALRSSHIVLNFSPSMAFQSSLTSYVSIRPSIRHTASLGFLNHRLDAYKPIEKDKIRKLTCGRCQQSNFAVHPICTMIPTLQEFSTQKRCQLNTAHRPPTWTHRLLSISSIFHCLLISNVVGRKRKRRREVTTLDVCDFEIW